MVIVWEGIQNNRPGNVVGMDISHLKPVNVNSSFVMITYFRGKNHTKKGKTLEPYNDTFNNLVS